MMEAHILKNIFLLVVILGIIFVIVSENRNPVKTIAWCMVLVFMPVAGIVLYILFGMDCRHRRLIKDEELDALKSITETVQGNEISEEEFYRRELTLHDGTVVCEYVHRNESVSTFSYMEREGSLLPITVVTYDDLAVGRVRSNAMNMGFYAAYCIEAAIAFAVYFLKRER